MAVSKGAVTLFMVAQLLLTMLAASSVAQQQGMPEPDAVKAAVAVQMQAAADLLKASEVAGSCGPALGSCMTRPCCDEKNFGCTYTELFGVLIAATCRPLNTCNDKNQCTLNGERITDTLFRPRP